jgi:hypothetical protein
LMLILAKEEKDLFDFSSFTYSSSHGFYR